ncbi:MAG: peptidase S24 [Actinomycetota bacterium]|nr:peptidase S24 [Actinomycetota bacterium]
MEPALREGDHLLLRPGGRPRPGRLVVVRLPGRPPAVKRAVRRDGAGWWVERDNPREGVDSWTLGAVPDDDVLATVLVRYWPLRRPLRWWRRRGQPAAAARRRAR